MRFAIHAELDPDRTPNFTFAVDVPDGVTVLRKEVAAVLVHILAWALFNPDARVTTRAEEAAFAAARKLPDGWNATLDAVNVVIDATSGAQSHSRTWGRASDGATVEAPCSPDGSSIPTTRDALLAYDADHPVASGAEA